MKNVLITGANSYIGEAIKKYLLMFPEQYSVNIKDTLGWKPRVEDFISYDVVFNVAGIAHIKETEQNRHLYFAINRDLAVNIAKAAKKAGDRKSVV